MLLRCHCGKWTVEHIILNGRPQLRVQLHGGFTHYLATPEQVRAHIGDEHYKTLEPVDSGETPEA